MLLAGLAMAFRPPSPAPLTPEARWEVRAGPAIASLARDLTSVADAPVWTPAISARLKADLTRAEAAGPPPAQAKAVVWRRVMHRVEVALSQGATDPASTRSELGTAGLELITLPAASPTT